LFLKKLGSKIQLENQKKSKKIEWICLVKISQWVSEVFIQMPMKIFKNSEENWIVNCSTVHHKSANSKFRVG
jgi:hypothetical protein